MALKSLSEALGLLVKKPIVWMPGLFAAFAIMFTYYMYTLFGVTAALACGIALLVIFPAFLAGTYGVIIGDKAASSDFRKYAAYGYFRCLIPNIVVFLIGYVLSNTLTYFLLMLGISVDVAFYFSIFLIIPLVFFFYFADITAMVNNLAAFRAIKDSALRVTTGSISVTAFYLFNVALFFCGFVYLFRSMVTPRNRRTHTDLTDDRGGDIVIIPDGTLCTLYRAGDHFIRMPRPCLLCQYICADLCILQSVFL